jgi:two-component system, chemotaxis family, sensor kinase CheA
MHLIRNAADHGIEQPGVRAAQGKSATGTVCLEAFHDSGSVVIRISDDGKGLAAEKIFAKAVEKGLVEADANLSDSDIQQLIFMPGFSTAESVTNISGRGVGMDVVRRNIEAVNGIIELHSEAGVGSTFSMRLPLTLAIIDGFQVRVGGAYYILPLDMVEECFELQETDTEQGDYINFRGEILPFMRMRDTFASQSVSEVEFLSGEEKPLRENIVVVKFGRFKAGLVVDELMGEHQTVIKPLGVVFQNLVGIGGATILGSGEVALIIDVPALVKKIIESAKADHCQQNIA